MIEIPGYKMLRQLGKGGMATVYLAVQESVDREVALKVMAPQLSLDPSFGERFLREARISAKLHHRHVVSIFDVGVHRAPSGDLHYIAMEYISGGPIMARDGEPLETRTALRCIREIAGALDYAHSKGFIHRDVKPDNILLREDLSCVLSDFGIARAADSHTVMTQTGSVVGTPHYMSPEALRGLKVDGRSDLYALGVVFYQLLTGQVPYQASDSLAIGIMHMTAPLPVMPRDYGFLQPLIQRMMAKKAEERVQSGAEVVRLVQQLEAQLRETPLPSPALLERVQRRGEAPLPELRAQRERTTMDLDPDAVGAVRTEPQLGRLEDVGHETWREPLRVNADVRRPPTVVPPPRQRFEYQAPPTRRWPWVLLVMLLGLGAAGYVWRQPLLAWLGREFPIAFGTPPEGPQPPRRPEPVDPQSRPEPTGPIAGSQAEIDALRSEAVAAERAGRWYGGSDSALARYAALRRKLPDDRGAKEGYEAALAKLEAELQRLLEAGDYSAAGARVQDLLAAEPGAPQVVGWNNRISAARDARLAQSSKVEQLLAQATDAFERGNLVTPANSSAAGRYREVLKLAPDNPIAKSGLRQIGTRLVEQARVALDQDQPQQALALLEQARSFGAGGKAMADLKERAERAGRPAPVRELGAAASAQLEQLVEQGSKAVAEGRWVEPPGSSAFDRLRAAQGIDRGNPRVEALEDQLIAALLGGIDQSLGSGDYRAAVEWADALKALGARDRNAQAQSKRVADAIAQAARATMASDPANARNLLRLLKTVARNHPAITELEQNLGS